MATVSFVDDITVTKEVAKPVAKKAASKTAETKADAKKSAAPKLAAPKKTVATHTNKTAARAKGVTKGDR